jgi:hypothetical protein
MFPVFKERLFSFVEAGENSHVCGIGPMQFFLKRYRIFFVSEEWEDVTCEMSKPKEIKTFFYRVALLNENSAIRGHKEMSSVWADQFSALVYE